MKLQNKTYKKTKRCFFDFSRRNWKKIRQITNITRSNLGKSPYERQNRSRSVNYHSERRPYIIAVISQKIIALLRIAVRDNILLAFPMFQLLKIVFTFAKDGVVARCESFQNVNPALVNLLSGAEDVNHPDFAWLFFKQF